MKQDSDADRLLDAAEELFYERGYQAVGMDALRSASGLPLKRIYALFGGKEAIAVAMLDRRDERWHAALAAHVDEHADPHARVLAIFDWLAEWLADEGHRGCAWINAFGELGGTSPDVVAAVRRHKARLRELIDRAVSETGAPRSAADAVFLLAEGCMVTAGIDGDPVAAVQARVAAARMLEH
ncbi:TetR/AcrR family transcriptional regulator [Microbacterium esteraromaticum]|uniref:TetR/AcrR family transcriptional regulator n=1 Tax=Microbacterium esteraromaticum TaxID=57043 RepID=A0A939IT88_9MICO|nr:TetR/AcrR family transcriptional regulator [Microbacterium esteraromaticum]MBN8205987.1 TetR/AcrR family transcriptional regulator [Microbacterium esteraromaticum]MBN8416142.1 TetR/AcrR family transcriptional regulator [Microbacterium esteraromaticum]